MGGVESFSCRVFVGDYYVCGFFFSFGRLGIYVRLYFLEFFWGLGYVLLLLFILSFLFYFIFFLGECVSLVDISMVGYL